MGHLVYHHKPSVPFMFKIIMGENVISLSPLQETKPNAQIQSTTVSMTAQKEVQ